ncbi:hypothetical protein AB5I41_02295 [Sphingomonas sp. MMS24-JH45]
MRWQHLSRNAAAGFDAAVTLLATPLYSNTTLVSFLPTLGWGGTILLMKKFDAHRFLELAQQVPPPIRCWCRCNISASWRCRTSRPSTCRASASRPARRHRSRRQLRRTWSRAGRVCWS